jgi:DNA-binding NtrC family response regulator
MRRFNILIIDDDVLFCDTLSMAEPDPAIRFFSAHTAAAGLTLCGEQQMDVVLLDQRLPDRRGAEICPEILAENQQTKIIFTTAYPDVDTAVLAVKTGAFDYLTKPFDIDQLMFSLKRAMRAAELEQVEDICTWKHNRQGEQTVFVGSSPAARRVREAAAMASGANAPVLLTGATGTGKSFLARCIHFQSKLGKRPFISINCGALPENLIESELFGHEQGAFTGATRQRRGIFEMADGGTLFLDEIGTLPVHLQVKLLGVLDDGCIQRLGSEKSKKVDVRIITATNLDLEEAVAKQTFRQDLIYRLSVLHIHLPSLMERLDDIEELCELFLAAAGRGDMAPLPPEELQTLQLYSWPGNIRELKNIIDRALILNRDGSLQPGHLLSLSSGRAGKKTVAGSACPAGNIGNSTGLRPLAEIERSYIYQVMQQVNDNQSQAAQILQISRSTLVRKLKRYENLTG